MIARAALAVSIVVAIAACGDDSSSSSSGGKGGDASCEDRGFADCEAEGTGTGRGGGGGGDSGGGGGDAGECGLEPVGHDEFCAEGAPPLDCATIGDATHALCGVALATPEPGDAPGGAGCFDPTAYPPGPGAPSTTRIQGFVRVYSNGCESANVTIEVFPVGADGALGTLIGTSATTPASCREAGEATDADGCADGLRYECAYTYPNVPTETALAVKTSGPGWTTSVSYGLYLTNLDAASGEVAYDPRVVATDDFSVLAQTAIGHPISAGKGMILGEVLDCGGSPVAGAVVGVDATDATVVYLTSVPDDPLPDLDATSTGELGRFGVFEAPSRPTRVAAAGSIDGEAVALGYQRAGVIADGVTFITFAGPLPSQLPP